MDTPAPLGLRPACHCQQQIGLSQGNPQFTGVHLPLPDFHYFVQYFGQSNCVNRTDTLPSLDRVPGQ